MVFIAGVLRSQVDRAPALATPLHDQNDLEPCFWLFCHKDVPRILVLTPHVACWHHKVLREVFVTVAITDASQMHMR